MKDSKNTQVWYDHGNNYKLNSRSEILEKLDNAVYSVHANIFGFYLVKEFDSFTFDYKIYSLEEKLINRIIRTYNHKNTGNLGVLLNGLRGTGKTITSKLICNKIEQPVILVSDALEGVAQYLNSIPQNITVFIDEYEKIFGDSSEMLTIMDGALNSEYRRLFLLTTNELNVDQNLIERPSRIRYMKKFGDLDPSVVAEIVDDFLEHKDLRNECIKFVSCLEKITVDIVKSVIEEVNIHNESPVDFADTFNVKKLTGKYDVYIENDKKEFDLKYENAELYYRPIYTEDSVDRNFYVNNLTLGKITSVISYDILEVTPYEKPKKKSDIDENVIYGTKPFIVRVDEGFIKNKKYRYSEYDEFYGGRHQGRFAGSPMG